MWSWLNRERKSSGNQSAKKFERPAADQNVFEGSNSSKLPNPPAKKRPAEGGVVVFSEGPLEGDADNQESTSEVFANALAQTSKEGKETNEIPQKKERNTLREFLTAAIISGLIVLAGYEFNVVIDTLAKILQLKAPEYTQAELDAYANQILEETGLFDERMDLQTNTFQVDRDTGVWFPFGVEADQVTVEFTWTDDQGEEQVVRGTIAELTQRPDNDRMFNLLKDSSGPDSVVLVPTVAGSLQIVTGDVMVGIKDVAEQQ